jgi:hypothetical protein
VAVAWFTGAQDTPRVRLARSEDAGASFGAPVTIDEGRPAGRVDVELLPDGAALVSWIELSTGGADVRWRRVDAQGGVDGAAVIGPISPARASGIPRIARAGARLLAVYTEAGERPRLRVFEARLD